MGIFLHRKKEQDLPDIGLVLDGGGARGPFQIGVDFALFKFGLHGHIRGIAGASVGGFMALLHTMDDPLKAYALWSQVDNQIILPFKKEKLKSVKNALLEKQGVFSRDGLVDVLNSSVDLGYLMRNAKYPVYLSLAEEVKDEKGKTVSYKAEYKKINGLPSQDILTLLLATSAIPYAFDPVGFEGHTYVDPMKADNEPFAPLLKNVKGLDMLFIEPLNSSHYRHTYESVDVPIVDFALPELMEEKKVNMLDFNPENSLNYVSLGYQTARLLLTLLKENGLLKKCADPAQKERKYYSLKTFGINAVTFDKMDIESIAKDALKKKE